MLDSLFLMRVFRFLAVLLSFEVCLVAQAPRIPRKPAVAQLDSTHPNIILITLEVARIVVVASYGVESAVATAQIGVELTQLRAILLYLLKAYA